MVLQSGMCGAWVNGSPAPRRLPSCCRQDSRWWGRGAAPGPPLRLPLGVEPPLQVGQLGLDGLGAAQRVELALDRVFARGLQQRAGVSEGVESDGPRVQAID